MSFLKGFLSGNRKPDPKPETEIQMSFWQIFNNQVVKEIQYVGYSPAPITMRIEITCQYSIVNMPLLFLNIRFAAPGLSATPGFLAMRWRTKTLDSKFCSCRLDQCPDTSTIVGQVDKDETGEILKILASNQSMYFWLGGEAGDLLRLPVPPEDGLEAKIDQAAKHPAARA